FRSFISLFGWLNNLTKFDSATENLNTIGVNVKVKGDWTIDSTVPLFDFREEVIFEGDGGTFTVPTANSINLGNNVYFKDMVFDYTYDPYTSSDPNYAAAFLANATNACIYVNVSTTNGNKNITIDNCLFTSNVPDRFPFIGF